MRLNPQHLSVAQLLQSRIFRIPDYQRAYSWQKRQRADLFDDIREVSRSGRDHFMATVVGLGRDKRLIDADEFGVVELVDGQQRVTTLVILLKAIEKSLDENDRAEGKILEDLRRLLVKGDDHNLVLLQTNHDSSNVFASYVRDGRIAADTVVTLADVNVIDAARECEIFVAGWKDDGSLTELVATIRHKLSVIYHELDDEGTVYRVFEVLNSRGLDVRWLDKTKSQLMAKIYEHVDGAGREEALREMQTAFKEIYRYLGFDSDLGAEALRFAGTWVSEDRQNRVLSEQDASEELVRHAGKELSTIIKAATWLQEVVRKVVELHADGRRAAVTRIAQARFLAVAVMLRRLDDETRRCLLREWEKVTFRIFTLAGKDSRSKVGEYVRLGYDVLADETEADEIEDRIGKLGEGFGIDEVLKDDWCNEWYGGFNEEVRYLLFRYEEYLARKGGVGLNESQWAKVWATDPARSIEHIMPQSSGKCWVHGIGNLTMLPPNVNSSLKDRCPSEKAERYVQTGMQATMEVGRVIQEGLKWNKKAARKRAEEMEQFVRREWGDAE